ncbi:VOC family protein [Cellulomonas fimi]|uniref:VOC family protein n=1 Tax=Cellulomonas fimi TaxID=1708 RepID=UPI002358FD16|nr:VOC family protein [Cellulomonas fimi]
MSTDWRTVDGVPTAWFDAASLVGGAALAARVVEVAPDALVDVRASGVLVRLDADAHADAVSAAARDLGLAADPSAPQRLSVVVESPDPTPVRAFWQGVLDYVPADGGVLVDPRRRDPALRVERSTDRRPLRNRLHLDVVRPAATVEQVRPGEPYGVYGVCHADPDGNEVDLVPGDALGDGPETSDWQSVFGAMAFYRVGSPEQQRDLVTAAAALADDAGFPLLVDVRPGLVVLDTGKDRWHPDAHRLDLDFTELAARLQRAARDLGATADPGLARFVQLFMDAVDVDAVRAFWLAALGYVPDGRTGLTDVVDPRWLNPVLAFQETDAADVERRRQRNRVHVEVAVPPDVGGARVATALAAGGRLLDEADGRWRVADPEGNELVVVG